MGAVYQASDSRLGLDVAVKELLVEGEELHRAFEREARLLANLSHRFLPRVTDHFTDGNGQYLVMDFIPGEDLKTILDREGRPFPIEQVLVWADQLLETLEYLHDYQPPIVHRDIKPSNLKLSNRDHIVLLDFGLAKGNAGGPALSTLSRSVFGYSPHFASLEQMQGEKSTLRADIYSFSATLYNLLSGKVPPDALTRATAVFNDDPDPLIPLSELDNTINREICGIIMSGLELKPSARPASATQMRFELRKARNSITALPTSDHTTPGSQHVFPDALPVGETKMYVQTIQPTIASPAFDNGNGSKERAKSFGGLILSIVAVLGIVALVCLTVGTFFWLASRKQTASPRSGATMLDGRKEISQQFKPAADASLRISAINSADGKATEGNGLLVTGDEAIIPLGLLLGSSAATVKPAADASALSTGNSTANQKNVLSVTRIDRDRQFAVVKLDGKGDHPFNVSTTHAPKAGEQVRLVGSGTDGVNIEEGATTDTTGDFIMVRMTSGDSSLGRTVVSESGDLVGLVIAQPEGGIAKVVPASAIADLMKKRTTPEPIEVAGAKEVLFDFRENAKAKSLMPSDRESEDVNSAVFGTLRASRDSEVICEQEDPKECLAEDRLAGRIEPEVLFMLKGSFTRPNSDQNAFIVAAHEFSASHADNFGTKRLAIFESKKLVFNVDIGDYTDVPKTLDLRHDGTQALLLTGAFSQMGSIVQWAKLVDLNGGKVSVLKDFGIVSSEDCGSGLKKSHRYAAQLLFTPSAAGSVPKAYRQDVYQSGCDESAWKRYSEGKIPGI